MYSVFGGKKVAGRKSVKTPRVRDNDALWKPRLTKTITQVWREIREERRWIGGIRRFWSKDAILSAVEALQFCSCTGRTRSTNEQVHVYNKFLRSNFVCLTWWLSPSWLTPYQNSVWVLKTRVDPSRTRDRLTKYERTKKQTWTSCRDGPRWARPAGLNERPRLRPCPRPARGVRYSSTSKSD